MSETAVPPGVVVALGLVGKPQCEVNRLRLFLVPLTFLVAAAALRRRFRRHPLALGALVLVLQFATAWLLQLRHGVR